ncbi:MAG: acetyl-CoA carboxylase biotin carboxyl carrier protein [Candidatus Omnitrophota bacterium]
MNLKEIKEVLQLMNEHGLSEIEIEKDGLKIKLRKGPHGQAVIEQVMPPVSYGLPAAAKPAAAAPAGFAGPAAEEAGISVVKSPMVGTFYAAPSPDQPPYVKVGQAVKPGDVLCIIEAMKLMNELKAEVAGTLTEILITNGQPVEYDQPLFKIKA